MPLFMEEQSVAWSSVPTQNGVYGVIQHAYTNKKGNIVKETRLIRKPTMKSSKIRKPKRITRKSKQSKESTLSNWIPKWSRRFFS
jgi:hypothetical protein